MRFNFAARALVGLVLLAGTVMSQTPSSDETRAVLVPREIALVAVAYQPDCPLQFENVSAAAGVDGGGWTNHNLRNRGTKPIRSFAVADSIGNRLSWDVARYKGPVAPGDLVPGEETSVQTVPLTKELREKLKLQGPMQGVIILMVTKVEFTDGTVYDDEKVYKALVSYMDSLPPKPNRSESLKDKRK